jgi:probable rRNA maturation factor
MFEETLQSVFVTCCTHLTIDSDMVNADVHFVSSDEIRDLNKAHRGIDRETDVLSFPMLLDLQAGEVPTRAKYKLDINPDTNKLELGDIVICTDVARAQAEQIGQSLEREVAFLYLHGLLHLLGYDHMTDDDENIMMTISRAVMEKV